MFPETFAAIRQLKPRAVLIENVRGLARPAFKPFVEYIVDHLRLPGLTRKKDEDWPDHHDRLVKALKRRPKDRAERYAVEWRPICVADYGVPQRRVRVIIVADLAECWSWPEPTHSHEALLLDQLDGFYWAEHDLPSRSPRLAPATRKRIRRVAHPTPMGRWRTLRDALLGLPDPVAHEETPTLNWHSLWPGARLYRGHRSSELDRPSKTIKAGVHGVAGGEHIVHLDSGRYRYLTVRECMRVQDLPDELEIDEARTAAIRQIGNAVPPTVGEAFGRAIARTVTNVDISKDRQTHVAEPDGALVRAA